MGKDSDKFTEGKIKNRGYKVSDPCEIIDCGASGKAGFQYLLKNSRQASSGLKLRYISVVARWSWPKRCCNVRVEIFFLIQLTAKVCLRTWGDTGFVIPARFATFFTDSTLFPLTHLHMEDIVRGLCHIDLIVQDTISPVLPELCRLPLL